MAFVVGVLIVASLATLLHRAHQSLIEGQKVYHEIMDKQHPVPVTLPQTFHSLNWFEVLVHRYSMAVQSNSNITSSALPIGGVTYHSIVTLHQESTVIWKHITSRFFAIDSARAWWLWMSQVFLIPVLANKVMVNWIVRQHWRVTSLLRRATSQPIAAPPDTLTHQFFWSRADLFAAMKNRPLWAGLILKSHGQSLTCGLAVHLVCNADGPTAEAEYRPSLVVEPVITSLTCHSHTEAIGHELAHWVLFTVFSDLSDLEDAERCVDYTNSTFCQRLVRHIVSIAFIAIFLGGVYTLARIYFSLGFVPLCISLLICSCLTFALSTLPALSPSKRWLSALASLPDYLNSFQFYIIWAYAEIHAAAFGGVGPKPYLMIFTFIASTTGCALYSSVLPAIVGALICVPLATLSSDSHYSSVTGGSHEQ